MDSGIFNAGFIIAGLIVAGIIYLIARYGRASPVP
jgi:hypothetical protein